MNATALKIRLSELMHDFFDLRYDEVSWENRWYPKPDTIIESCDGKIINFIQCKRDDLYYVQYGNYGRMMVFSSSDNIAVAIIN